ncbi:MAG: collagen-like protein, partial [Flavobacteriales bacterium]|nr:collagen-like protein [Flavobacteriales bacterium]
MKRVLLLATLLVSLTAANTFAQDNMGIGTSTPAPSAVLDLSATDKGFLVPRLTTAQRTAIVSPATGLMVFETNSSQFWYFNGTIWVQAIGPQGPAGPAGIAGPQGLPGVDGQDGATGAQGPQGLPGVDGQDGATGAQGPQGLPGVDGQDGATGAQGPQGLPGVDGQDGAT